MVFKPKYDAPTEMISARIPVPLHEQLKDRAKEEGKPKNAVLIDILENDLGVQRPSTTEGAFG